jgi:type 1 fimbria pilin
MKKITAIKKNQMKKYLAALSSAALITIAPYALASSTDLTVTGLITPVACTPSLSNGGVIDNGKISAATLNQTTYTKVGEHPMQLSVTCEAARLVVLKTIDNKPGTTTERSFGLGLTGKGEKLGNVIVKIDKSVADGVEVEAIYSVDDGASWQDTPSIQPEDLTSVAFRSDYGTPIDVKDLAMDLKISTYIARADSLTLTDEVTLDGSATIEMIYL